MEKYNGIIDEVLFYSERSENGRWIIPIEVDWDYTLTKCSSWETGEMVLNEEAFEIMKRWTKDYNVGWILNSMRNDELMKKPLETLEKYGIKPYSLRKNPRQMNDENNNEVTKSFAVFCIDDRNVNISHEWLENCNRPHVNWKEVDKIMSPILQYMSDTLDKVKL